MSASAAVPWGFVGASRLEQARALLPSVWDVWQKAWCFGRGSATTVRVDEVAPGDADHVVWLHARVPAGGVWLAYAHEADWHGLLFGAVERAPQDALATDLIAEARTALLNSVLQALGHEPVAALASDASGMHRHACPRLVVQPAGQPVALMLDASLLDACLPARAPGEALVQRERAIGAARVKLRVSLPLSAVSAATLSQLQVGDVLPTATPLARRFQLSLSDVPQASGCLIRSGDRLALQLVDH